MKGAISSDWRLRQLQGKHSTLGQQVGPLIADPLRRKFRIFGDGLLATDGGGCNAMASVLRCVWRGKAKLAPVVGYAPAFDGTFSGLCPLADVRRGCQ